MNNDIFLRSGTLQSESNPFILWMVGFEVYYFGINFDLKVAINSCLHINK
jgi:hypothetical protein